MTYSLGWKRSVRPFKLALSPQQLPTAGAIADTVDMTPFLPPVLDQNGCGSCVGHAFSDAIFGTFAAAGKALQWIPSPRGIYQLARCVTRSEAGQSPVYSPLEDLGSYPTDAVDGIEKWGVRPMRSGAFENSTDCTPENVNKEPTQLDLQDDAKHLCDSYEIRGWGSQLIADLCAALTAKSCCPIGVFVDTSFMRWAPSTGFVGSPKNPYDANGGGHMLDIVGYTRAGLLANNVEFHLPKAIRRSGSFDTSIAQSAAKLAPDARIWFIKNSWGTGYGVNGYALATDPFITDVQAGDISAIRPNMRST